MTDLKKLLAEREIQTVAIVDDAFDSVPRPDDLNADDWDIFFDDLTVDDKKLLTRIYPGYLAAQVNDLQNSEEFIELLWSKRNQISSLAWDRLFGVYEKTSLVELQYVKNLQNALEAFNLECIALGQDITPGAKRADLVFMDLFLGYQLEVDNVIKQAIDRVKELIGTRRSSPPLIILMSRSPRLWEHRNDFRDEAGILGSMFRVERKADLLEEGVLERQLTRLANHNVDAKRVARFVDAWDVGLESARERFIQHLRRMDLPDLAQIRSLLLESEDQELGEYLLDVADRVLQHEIEADSDTMAAARDLNEIDIGNYPAPHLEGSPELQSLVFRMVFQNFERNKLSLADGSIRPEFGEIFRWQDGDTGVPSDNVCLIVTPACDLVRDPIEHVLVLPGVIRPLTPRDWSYRSNEIRTPIVILPDGTHVWIKWDLKSRRTINFAQKHETDKLELLGRLRETYAIELQQRLLADMARVGQPADLPAVFPVNLELYCVSSDGTARLIDMPTWGIANCFVGRAPDSKSLHHLVLGELECDALHNVIRNLQESDVHSAARASLAELKREIDIFVPFEKGRIEVPLNSGTPKTIQGSDHHIYFYIYRNEGISAGDQIITSRRKGPLTLKVSDITGSD